MPQRSRKSNTSLIAIVVAVIALTGAIVAALINSYTNASIAATQTSLQITTIAQGSGAIQLRATPVPQASPLFAPTPLSTPWGFKNSKTYTDPEALCSITAHPASQAGREDAVRLEVKGDQSGYCSWVIPLNGYNASAKKQLTFWIKGEKGGEAYEVGIKDKITVSGQDPKIPEIASASWTKVSIALDYFGHQDLSSLDNFSLNFRSAGSDTIYVDQLIFTP